MSARCRITLIGGFSFTLIFASFVSLVHAEDVLWNTSPTVNLCNAQGAGYACASRLIDPNITISYHAQVTDAAGNIIACGSSVPAGTALKLSFISHVYTDVYWFGTGFSFDSPYGEWRANGEAPPVSWEEKDYTGTIYTGAGGSGDTPLAAYRPLVVNPPVKTIGGLSGFGCTASGSDGSQLCTPLQGGTYTPVFNFGDTYGYFYWRFKNLNNGVGVGDNIPLVTFTTPGNPSQIPYYGPNGYDYHGEGITLGDTYKLQVPAQAIQCPITVLPPIGNPPATPTLTSGGACVVGTPNAVNVQSTDPDGDQLRYGIDWDANGVVDQWAPPSGYVNSGTLQSISRTYAIAGSKTVKALAQDKNGNTSGWASLTFKCSGSTTVGINEGDTGGNDGGNGGTTQLLPDIDLRIIPSLVRSGNTTKVNWSSVNVRSCSVSAQNGDAWTGLLSPLGGQISKPIAAETTYTLTCLDLNGGTLTKTAKVRIIPTFQEK